MNDILEFENDKKSIKTINLDDFSIEDLLDYLQELEKEVKRAKLEIEKKKKLQEEAKRFFK